MSKIFISYRRKDSLWATHSIDDSLTNIFGENSVFVDYRKIDYGDPIDNTLNHELSICEVMICIIGPDWLSSKNREGTRRLEDVNDYVRHEIETAFDRKISVIPILIGDTTMPNDTQLPKSINYLSNLRFKKICEDSIESDIKDLARSLSEILKIPIKEPGGLATLVKLLKASFKFIVITILFTFFYSLLFWFISFGHSISVNIFILFFSLSILSAYVTQKIMIKIKAKS